MMFSSVFHSMCDKTNWFEFLIDLGGDISPRINCINQYVKVRKLLSCSHCKPRRCSTGGLQIFFIFICETKTRINRRRHFNATLVKGFQEKSLYTILCIFFPVANITAGFVWICICDKIGNNIIDINQTIKKSNDSH